MNYSKGKPGIIDIEFEQIVFNDIVMPMSKTKGQYDGANIGFRFNQKTKEGFDTAYDDYSEWINKLTNNGTSYPNLNSISDFNNEYKIHLNNFLNYGEKGYTNNAQILNIAPDA